MRRVNSGDESRRRHERQGDRVRVLIDRYRRGGLSSFHLKAAAWLGHDDAVEAAHRLGVQFLTRSSEPDREIEWGSGRLSDTKRARGQGWAIIDSGDGYRIESTTVSGGLEGDCHEARESVRNLAFEGDATAVKALIFLRELAKSDDYDYFAYGREYARILDPEKIVVMIDERAGSGGEEFGERVYRRRRVGRRRVVDMEITDAEAIDLVRPIEKMLAESWLEEAP